MTLGSFLGSKVRVRYQSDSGVDYALTRDQTLANIPGVDLPVIDPGATPPVTGAAPPGRFSPRGVWWQANDDVTPPELRGSRKFLICGEVTSTLYASTSSQAVTIDGIAGRTTGRVGERLTF